MGLDAVEIVIGIEEAFEITLPDEEVMKTRTVRDIISLVLSKVAEDPGDPACLSMVAFHRLRRGLRNLDHEMDGRIRPSSTLRSLIPPNHAGKFWERWQKQTGVSSFPELSRPGWIQTGNWLATMGSGWYGVVALDSWGMGVLIALMTGTLAMWLTSSVERTSLMMLGTRTMGDLADHLVTHKPSELRGKRKTWSRSEVRTVVRKVISDTLGVKRFSDEADIVKDLGAS